MRILPHDVQVVTERYLKLVGAAAPGLVEAFYLVGSVALGDYRPGSSDVDYIAVTGGAVDEVDLAALAGVHGELGSPMSFDGVYVTAADLRADPARCGRRPYSLRGRFTEGEAFEANPAVWQLLSQSPVVLRGEAPRVATDTVRLADWTRENLDGYWRKVREAVAFCVPERLDDEMVVWCALGPARLLYTLETGLIISKAGAGEWASRVMGESPVLREALRLRRGEESGYTSRGDRREDLVKHMDGLFERM